MLCFSAGGRINTHFTTFHSSLTLIYSISATNNMDASLRLNKDHVAISFRIRYRWFFIFFVSMTLIVALMAEDCELNAMFIITWVTYLTYFIEANLHR